MKQKTRLKNFIGPIKTYWLISSDLSCTMLRSKVFGFDVADYLAVHPA